MQHCFDKIGIQNGDIENQISKGKEISIKEVEDMNSEDEEKETADNGKERY